MGVFAASVAEWAEKVKEAGQLIFQEAAQEVVAELNALVPVDTGFLRASLVASTTAMPSLTRPNPGGESYAPDMGEIVLAIAGADIGDTIYLGYTASYGAHVHYGANGRAGRPWVAMVAQRWPIIVQGVAERVKARLGL